jgi:hypothetical protein
LKAKFESPFCACSHQLCAGLALDAFLRRCRSASKPNPALEIARKRVDFGIGTELAERIGFAKAHADSTCRSSLSDLLL